MSCEARVFHSLEEVPSGFGPCALTIGNFDGVHAGHRQILRRVAELARERGWQPAVLTFDPHPTRVVAPGRAPRLMTTPAERCELLSQEGIRNVLVLPFDSTVAAWPPDYFVREVLVGRLAARAILVGADFRFGHKHEGNAEQLEALGRELGFLVELVPPVMLRGRRISSSTIRQLVEEGRVALACRCLTRPFFLEGAVVAGRGIGRRETVPTLNLAPECEVIPKTGVYVTHTRDSDSGRVWPSITNVGYRPTFGGEGLTVETFLLASLEETPSRIRVDFHLRLRDERKFESAEALKARIGKDVARALKWFRMDEEVRVKMREKL